MLRRWEARSKTRGTERHVVVVRMPAPAAGVHRVYSRPSLRAMLPSVALRAVGRFCAPQRKGCAPDKRKAAAPASNRLCPENPQSLNVRLSRPARLFSHGTASAHFLIERTQAQSKRFCMQRGFFRLRAAARSNGGSSGSQQPLARNARTTTEESSAVPRAGKTCGGTPPSREPQQSRNGSDAAHHLQRWSIALSETP